jgi:hypothetical protein
MTRNHRRHSSPLRFLLAFLALGGLLACASSTPYPGSVPRTALIIDNTTSALTSMSVHLLTPEGGRVALGTVKLNESRTFTLRRSLRAGSYRLEARGTRKVVSSEFRLDAGDLIEWDLRRNRVRFQGHDSGV